MDRPEVHDERFSSIARALAGEPDVQRTLQRAVESAAKSRRTAAFTATTSCSGPTTAMTHWRSWCSTAARTRSPPTTSSPQSATSASSASSTALLFRRRDGRAALPDPPTSRSGARPWCWAPERTTARRCRRARRRRPAACSAASRGGAPGAAVTTTSTRGPSAPPPGAPRDHPRNHSPPHHQPPARTRRGPQGVRRAGRGDLPRPRRGRGRCSCPLRRPRPRWGHVPGLPRPRRARHVRAHGGRGRVPGPGGGPARPRAPPVHPVRPLPRARRAPPGGRRVPTGAAAPGHRGADPAAGSGPTRPAARWAARDLCITGTPQDGPHRAPGRAVPVTEGPPTSPHAPHLDLRDRPTGPGDLADLADLARQLQAQDSPQAVMDAAVTSAVALVDGAQHASISLVRSRRAVTSAAATDTTASDFDALQGELGQGPCMDAVHEHAVVQVADLAGEDRWPDLARRGPELGVRSMLCYQLFVHGSSLGGLNLLADGPDAFGEEARTTGQVLAAHAAVALADAQKLDHPSTALVDRDVIGQAKGILTERHRLTPEQAFAVLAKASQDRNVKLHVVAEQLTRSGSLER